MKVYYYDKVIGNSFNEDFDEEHYLGNYILR